MTPSSPHIIDKRYKLGKCIGTGGMGCVYEAVHVGVGRPVAIKTLRQDIEINTRSVSRLQREARITGAIGHDHICEVTDTGTTDEGLPYMVMPLLRGQTLKSLLQTEAPLPFDRSIGIICRVLEGLEAAHAHGVVHRDLKPGNVFLTKIGNQDDFVKILDFGISKRISGAETTDLTRTGTVVGTPLYMSPEQACGATHIDHRADIYSAGVLLYEMITGARPFEGNTYNEIITKIAGAPFPSPITVNPQIPKALNRLVLKSMARNPDDRFSTAAKMRAALMTVSNASTRALPFRSDATGTGRGEAAPFAVRIDRPRKSANSAQRWFIAGVIAAALLLSGGLYYFVFLSGRPKDANSASVLPTPPLERKSPSAELHVSGSLPHPDTRPVPAPTEAPLSSDTADETFSPSVDTPSTAVVPQKKPIKAPRTRKPKKRDARPNRKSAPKTQPTTESVKPADTVNTFTGKKNTLFSEDYDQ